MIAVTQSISKIFAILLHKIFPIARFVFPSSAEKIFTASSGVEVQKATIVNPITRGEIRNFKARELAPDTRVSAHLIKTINQRTNKIYSNI